MTPEEKVRCWLETAIIGLRLCPFAQSPWQKKLVGLACCEGSTRRSILEACLQELDRLHKTKPEKLATSLLIVPTLTNFDDYLETLAAVEELITDQGLEGQIQVASFHPDYQFAGSAKEDVTNFTNRSPLPIFHFIREDDISKLQDAGVDLEAIPHENQLKMKNLGIKQVREIWKQWS